MASPLQAAVESNPQYGRPGSPTAAAVASAPSHPLTAPAPAPSAPKPHRSGSVPRTHTTREPPRKPRPSLSARKPPLAVAAVPSSYWHKPPRPHRKSGHAVHPHSPLRPASPPAPPPLRARAATRQRASTSPAFLPSKPHPAHSGPETDPAAHKPAPARH